MLLKITKKFVSTSVTQHLQVSLQIIIIIRKQLVSIWCTKLIQWYLHVVYKHNRCQVAWRRPWLDSPWSGCGVKRTLSVGMVHTHTRILYGSRNNWELNATATPASHDAPGQTEPRIGRCLTGLLPQSWEIDFHPELQRLPAIKWIISLFQIDILSLQL